jgi:hypothetical protein
MGCATILTAGLVFGEHHNLLEKIKDIVAKLQDWREQESGKAAVKGLILGEIYTSELLTRQAFPLGQRQPYVDEIFQYVLNHQFTTYSAVMS